MKYKVLILFLFVLVIVTMSNQSNFRSGSVLADMVTPVATQLVGPVEMHTVDQRRPPDEDIGCPGGTRNCREFLVGAVARAFDRDDPDIGENPSQVVYADIWNSGKHLAECIIDATGHCTLTEPGPGNYLIVVRFADGDKIVFVGKPTSEDEFIEIDDNIWEGPQKEYQVNKQIRRDGTVQYRGGIIQVVEGLPPLSGAPNSPATEAIPDRDFEAREQDYSNDHPELGNVFVSFNTLILSFALETTVGEANEILIAIDAEIVGGIPGVAGVVEGILFLRVPTTNHEEMIILLESLRTDHRIVRVVQDALLEETIIPGPNAGNPANWRWTLTPSGGNWGLELIRAPHMWNLNDALDRAGRTTATGVLDTGFADDHEDLVYEENQTPGNESAHGTHVAGTIGASFNNAIGVDGVNPFARLVVRTRDRSLIGGDTVFQVRQSFGESHMSGLADFVRSRNDIRVINISMGYNWGLAGVNQNTNTTAQHLVAEQGALFRTLQIILSREGDLPLIVPAAGNDSNSDFGVQAARWGSPFNYAGLVLDPPDVFGVSNIIVTESIANAAGMTGGATRSSFSNTGGHISAPGSNIMSTSWSAADPNNLYESMSGTSMAAPHVTGLISYLYTVDPTLTHEEVRELLFTNSLAVDGDASNRIDAYATVLDIDRVRDNDKVRLMLLDVTGDDLFDENDLESYLNAFDAFEPFDVSCSVPPDDGDACPIYSRFDLNGDGLGGGDGVRRFDLNRDGNYASLTVEIEGEQITFSQAALTDLDILCYYAYSPLYGGSSSARSELLSELCTPVSVILPPNEPVTIAITVDLPDPQEGEVGADVMFNVDLSGSFGPDLSTFQTRASEIVAALQESLTDLRVGISSFVDAPCSNFGSASWGDYGHRLDLALTDDFDAFQATLDDLQIYNGADGPESQLESMYQTMTGHGFLVNQGTACDGVADIAPSTPGWSLERLRFLLHSTDATFHRPGDISWDGVPYPYPRDVSDVIETAQLTGTTIFFLDSGGGTDNAKYDIAEATGGDVFLLDTASSEVVEAVRDAAQSSITKATVRLVPSGDDAGFVDSIEPEVFTDIDLTVQDNVTFNVTFVNTVQLEPFEQVFRFEFVVTVNGAIIEVRSVVVIVPAEG